MTKEEKEEKMNKARTIEEYLFYSGTITYTQELGNIDALEEWMKWLSYHSKEEMEQIEIIKKKKVETLTFAEINILKEYSDIKKLADILIRYLNEDCTYLEYLELANFMKNNSIEKYMKEKLTNIELQEVENRMNELIKLSEKELDEAKKLENYRQVSIIDAYVLHMLLKRKTIKHLNELNQEIYENTQQNNLVMQKSMINASKYFVI